MKKLIYVLFTLLAISCSNPPEVEPAPYIPNIGEYTPVSIISDTPIDANADGEYSNDFIEEFKKAGQHSYSMKIWYNDNEKMIYVDVFIQYMERPPSHYPNSDYTVIYSNTMGAFVNYIDYSIEETVNLLDRDGNPTDSKIIEFTIIDDETILLKIFHEQIYDENTKEWKSITLEGLYTKIITN